MDGTFLLLSSSATCGLVCGLVGAAVMLRRARRGTVPVDLPSDRRLHTVPTPRGGGVGIPVAGLVAALLALLWPGVDTWRSPGVGVAVVWALPNGVLGWVDDRWPMRSRTKFAIQGAAALATTWWLRVDQLALPLLGTLSLGVLAIPFTILWLVWMANAFNFMDGIDGLAAGSGAIFCGGFLALAAVAGSCAPAPLAAGLGAALLGFLRYNWPPARIFMGDSGSLYAGAALGGLAVAGSQPACGAPFAATVLLLGPFVWDATYTIAWRALGGHAMRPHRTHLYQRLVLAGCSRGKVRWGYYLLGAASVLGAVSYPGLSPAGQAGVVLAALGAGIGLVLLTRRQERAAR